MTRALLSPFPRDIGQFLETFWLPHLWYAVRGAGEFTGRPDSFVHPQVGTVLQLRNPASKAGRWLVNRTVCCFPGSPMLDRKHGGAQAEGCKSERYKNLHPAKDGSPRGRRASSRRRGGNTEDGVGSLRWGPLRARQGAQGQVRAI